MLCIFYFCFCIVGATKASSANFHFDYSFYLNAFTLIDKKRAVLVNGMKSLQASL